MSSTKWLVLSVACVCALASSALAGIPVVGPGFFVTPGGLNGSGNRLWNVAVSADPALIQGGSSSLAIEMGFTSVGANLLSATLVPGSVFDTGNPGNSPFAAPINGVQNGIVLHLPRNEAFAAYGSSPVVNGNPNPFLTLTTAGSGPTSINWLGAYQGNGRIAQEGVNYSFYRGTATVPEPATMLLALGGVALMWVTRRRALAA